MSKNSVTIVATSEKELVANFIKSVMNESAFTENNHKHSLKCEIGTTTSVDETNLAGVDAKIEEVYSNTSNIPQFKLTIDGNTILQFTRGASVSQFGYFYNVKTYFGKVEINDSGSGTSYSGNLIPYGDFTGMYTWKYQIFSNDNVLYFVMGRYNDTFPLLPKLKESNSYIKTYQVFSYIKNTGTENAEWVGGLHTSMPLYDIQGFSSYTFKRLGYINNESDATAIEVIQNKIATRRGGSNKVITMDNIWDSSYNEAVMFPVNIGNNEYVYLDNYTLMPV